METCVPGIQIVDILMIFKYVLHKCTRNEHFQVIPFFVFPRSRGTTHRERQRERGRETERRRRRRRRRRCHSSTAFHTSSCVEGKGETRTCPDMAPGKPPPTSYGNARMRYVGAAACVVCGVYWWRWWQHSKLKRAALSSSMAIEELAFAWLAFSGSLRRFMTNSADSNGKQLPTEVSRVLELLRHPSVTGFATRVGEGFATGIANSIRSSGRGGGAAQDSSAFGADGGGGSSIMRLFTKSPKTNINAVLSGPQKIENDGWKGIVEVLVMSLSTDKGKELAVSVTKAFSKELMRSWLERDRGGDRGDARSTAQQRRLAGKFPGVLRDSSNMQLSDTGGVGDALSFHKREQSMRSNGFGGNGAASNAMMTLPMLAFELATTEYVCCGPLSSMSFPLPTVCAET